MFGFLNFLDASLYLTDIVLQITKSTTEPASLTSDQVDMSLVYFFEFLKLMRLMRVSKQTTVRTNRNLARLAKVAQRRVMLGTQFLLALGNLTFLLLHKLHNICKESAGDKLISSQATSAMWALRSSLFNPFAQAITAG